MIISGIVIRTKDDAELERLRPLLAAEPRLTPGASRAGSLAAALCFDSLDEGEGLHDWLHSLPGVRSIDVVDVQYDLPNEVTV